VQRNLTNHTLAEDSRSLRVTKGEGRRRSRDGEGRRKGGKEEAVSSASENIKISESPGFEKGEGLTG